VTVGAASGALCIILALLLGLVVHCRQSDAVGVHGGDDEDEDGNTDSRSKRDDEGLGSHKEV